MDAIERLQQHYVTSHDDVMRRIAQLMRQTCATQSSSSDAEVKATDNIVEVVQEEERRSRKVANNVFSKTGPPCTEQLKNKLYSVNVTSHFSSDDQTRTENRTYFVSRLNDLESRHIDIENHIRALAENSRRVTSNLWSNFSLSVKEINGKLQRGDGINLALNESWIEHDEAISELQRKEKSLKQRLEVVWKTIRDVVGLELKEEGNDSVPNPCQTGFTCELCK